jgi:hypothetical protein
MSKLPQADELPHADEGYDPARVEEAFAAFADRVRELESVASELRAELTAVRAERTAPTRYDDDEDWPAEARLANGGLAPSPDWVAGVPPPFASRPALPRLLLEGAFLLLVAVLAGLADLAAAWIVLVMAVAWCLVVLTEWAAAEKGARWRLEEIAPPADTGSDATDKTGPWDMPVVEATVVESAPDPESKTIVAKLPTEPQPDPEPDPDPDPDPESPPKRRRGLRRRKPDETSTADRAADPWEA